MVVFTCQGCNASLKKKQVSDHVRFCRKSTVLTCIDCLKDFDHLTSQKHLCTLTESQKYGGLNYVAKPSANKQALWVECALFVASSPSLSGPVKTLISTMAENPALPRVKKRFINAVMNNGTLRSKQSHAEEAFDLIAKEMHKRESDETDKTNGTGKRKTISETQEDPDAVSSSSNEEKKKDKKKKKKRDSSNNVASQPQETLNGTHEVSDSANKPKGKKSKRKTISETQPDVEPNKKVPCEQSTNSGDQAVGEKKKKKKKKSVSYEDEKLSPGGDKPSSEDTENVVPGVCPVNGDTTGAKQDIMKLSKKERKKLLKQKKFAAELESIENYQRDEANPDESVDEKKKKKKKNKENVTAQESSKDAKAGGEAQTEKPKGEVCKEEAEVGAEEKPKNFKWESVIREALKSASDHEMSLKRLSKKVCGEYVLVHGMKDSYDDILLRFNKKVVKTPGVKVFKDKAMLCHS